MPSKAIGMGVCPRCGKPGTVVIKAGNYVYVKHGNTWHYIGTIDKVNLNKILIKDEKLLEKIKENNISYKNIKRNKMLNNKIILLIALTAMAVIAIMFLSGYINTYKKVNASTFSLLKCNATEVNKNGIYIYTCVNSTNNIISYSNSIRYINNNELTKYNFISGNITK